jgi:hypothetical protein
MKSILDPDFRYTPSDHTDLRKTFARVRYEQQKAAEQAREQPAANVTPIAKREPQR